LSHITETSLHPHYFVYVITVQTFFYFHFALRRPLSLQNFVAYYSVQRLTVKSQVQET